MDLLKHGESAYPADAWVEQQYMQDFSMEVREDWEMLNFWKSFVNGFTYNQVGGEIFFYSIAHTIAILENTTKQRCFMCFFLCLVLLYTNIASSSH